MAFSPTALRGPSPFPPIWRIWPDAADFGIWRRRCDSPVSPFPQNFPTPSSTQLDRPICTGRLQDQGQPSQNEKVLSLFPPLLHRYLIIVNVVYWTQKYHDHHIKMDRLAYDGKILTSIWYDTCSDLRSNTFSKSIFTLHVNTSCLPLHGFLFALEGVIAYQSSLTPHFCYPQKCSSSR